MDIEDFEEFELPETELEVVPWPALPVTLGIVSFCLAFWAGVYFLVSLFFG